MSWNVRALRMSAARCVIFFGQTDSHSGRREAFDLAGIALFGYNFPFYDTPLRRCRVSSDLLTYSNPERHLNPINDSQWFTVIAVIGGSPTSMLSTNMSRIPAPITYATAAASILRCGLI